MKFPKSYPRHLLPRTVLAYYQIHCISCHLGAVAPEHQLSSQCNFISCHLGAAAAGTGTGTAIATAGICPKLGNASKSWQKISITVCPPQKVFFNTFLLSEILVNKCISSVGCSHSYLFHVYHRIPLEFDF